MASRNRNSDSEIDLMGRFQQAEVNDLPEFSNYDKPLEMGLWVLWVAKEKLNISKLKAQQIVDVLVEVKEVSVDCRAIVNGFNRAGGKLHRYPDEGATYYAIMKAGKDHLIEIADQGSIKVFYFEPGKQHHSKVILADNILSKLEGELKIVDPYCGVRTLDVLVRAGSDNGKFLTRLDNLAGNKKNEFLRELKDFNSEHTNIQFRDYPNTDIHDRYVISARWAVILGYSIKDLGSRESFAIALERQTNRNVFDALTEGFDRRWKSAKPL